MSLHVSWSLQSIISSEIVSETTLSSLLSKRNALLEQLEYYLNSLLEVEGGSKSGSQLGCRVSLFLLFFIINFYMVINF